jgi:uncharacterized membrane protein YkvA (DUF1232 family)
MTTEISEKQFVKRVQELLVMLPYDIKVFFEAISDENLPMEARKVAAGAIIYCLSPSDPIPDSAGILGFVDDVTVVKIALSRLLELGGEEAAEYPKRFTDQYNGLEDDLALIRGYLGENMAWLEKRIRERLPTNRYKGKSTEEYLKDGEAQSFLYTEGLAFTTGYEIDEKEAAKLVSGEAVREVFRQRKELEDKRLPS